MGFQGNKWSSAIIWILLFSSSLSAQTQTCSQNADHPDYRTVVQSNTTGTITREYILHTPKDYNVENPTPLVINLHGFGDCAADYAEAIGEYYKFNELADKENFIVAYPQGAYRPEKEDTYWEPGDNGSEDIYENDVYFIDQLIADIADELNVDINKIYAIGYSNGGMMVYSLACNRSEVISAVGIMSGTMLDEECSIENPIPIIKFHGIADEVLPYNGSMWYSSVSDVIDYWLDQNNIPAENNLSIELNDGNVEKVEYYSEDDDTNNCIHLYTIIEEYDKPGDHVWFSEEINTISPNEIVWEFFSKGCPILTSTNQTEESTYRISPNPFIDFITIESTDLLNQQMSIYTTTGKLLQEERVNTIPYRIDLSHLSQGTYLVNINGSVQKLIKI